ncbi:MAG: helix-turn-helix transcriptional regulator [Tyzzerella sp.]|nr:helix-turn-helix transcriptional regulator [Tyzzerella sp.]
MKKRPEYSLSATGLRIRALRKARNISVEQIRQYMNFESAQAIYKWEGGKCFPQADNLLALAHLFEVSPLDIMVEKRDITLSLFKQMICAFIETKKENVVYFTSSIFFSSGVSNTAGFFINFRIWRRDIAK